MPLDSTLSLWNDDGWNIVSEVFSWDNHWDIIRKIGPDQKFITFINDDWKEVKISLLDLDNIWNFSDDEISEMLKSILWVTIQSPEWLNLVNELAQRALGYLRKELLYTDAELRWVWNIDFKSSKDIIKFFNGTKNVHWLQKCMLAKVGMLFNDGVWFSVEEKRKKTIDVMENKVVKSLEDLAKKSSLGFDEREEVMDEFKEKWKSSFDGSFFVENDALWTSKKISFTVEFREKTIESTISKSLREKDYVNQWDIMDFLWIRIITKTKEEKVLLMNYISQLAFKYWEYRIKNKNGVSQTDLENILWSSDFFSQNTNTALFIQKLEESFSKVEKRMNTALNYSDIKFVPVWDNNKLSFEIMFLDEGHSNDTGLAHHTPFSYFRKIAERIRLEWFITSQAIIRISDTLVEKISKSSMAELWNISPTDLMKEMLIDISSEIPERWVSLKLKNRQEIQAMKKIELEFELKRVLPLYYQTKLFTFSDSKWNISRRKKFTNKVGLENLSVLTDKSDND